MNLNVLDRISASVILFLASCSGGKATRNEIKQATQANNVPLDNSLNQLLNLKMLIQRNKFFSLNLENVIISNIISEIKEKFSFLPLQIQFILINFIEVNLNIKGIKEIILFSNYSKPVFNNESNIDLAIVFDNKVKNKESKQKKISKAADKISKQNNKIIKIHFLLEQELKYNKEMSKGIYLI